MSTISIPTHHSAMVNVLSFGGGTVGAVVGGVVGLAAGGLFGLAAAPDGGRLGGVVMAGVTALGVGLGAWGGFQGGDALAGKLELS
jgi:hypothetical protein